VNKSINGSTTQFLYDELNPIQEIQNGTPSVNLLTGLGIDEYFQRGDSGGMMAFLSDALGQTIWIASYGGPFPFPTGGGFGASLSNYNTNT
jgi:hypothetical protein